MTETIRISEIFGPTIQGEGALIGQPTVFVRTGGCDFRCAWCDTMHAVDSKFRDEWKPMSAKNIFAQVQNLSGGKPLMVTISGGNPAIQPLGGLIALGKKHSYSFALETQGSIAADWFSALDILTLSPKPPSSRMAFDPAKLDECIAAAGPNPQTALKFVVLDDADYAFAKSVSEKYPSLPVYLQPCNDAPPPASPDTNALMARMRWLVDKIKDDGWFTPRILPQLHVMMWGNQKGV